MEHASLSSLIHYLESGNKVHICVAFQSKCGNRMTRCTESQTIHDRPVCMAAKKQPKGLASCYRCRMTVQKAVVRSGKSLAGFCTNGVYEYCRPVMYEGRAVCVIFVGNILTEEPHQHQRLASWVNEQLLQTMERNFTLEDCARVADILESYICFLLDRYGTEDKSFDPLVENIKNYIHENLVYDISMEELAAVFGYSPKHLGRLFKQRTGQTVRQYCNKEKTEKAKQLLADTDLPVERVAVEAGFAGAAYFDRVFRKITGTAPHSYRKRVKEQRI